MQSESDTIYKYEISLSTLNSSQSQINSQKTLEFLLQPLLLQFSEMIMAQINQQLKHALRQEELAFQMRQLFVLFEKELGCDPATDHLVYKNVYPLYQRQFEQIFKTLQNKLQIALQSECTQLSDYIKQKIYFYLGDIIEMADSFSLAFAMSCKETVDMVSLLEKVQMLSIEEKIKLRREIQLLKEQLVTKHRIETLYTGDSESNDILKRRLKNIAQVTTNQLMDEIVEISNEKRAVELQLQGALMTNEKNSVQLRQLSDQAYEREKHIEAYESQVNDLIMQLAELKQQLSVAQEAASASENERQRQQQEYEAAENERQSAGRSATELPAEVAAEELEKDIMKQLNSSEAPCPEQTTAAPAGIRGLCHRIHNSAHRDRILSCSSDYAAAEAAVEILNLLDELNQFQQHMGVASANGARPDSYKLAFGHAQVENGGYLPSDHDYQYDAGAELYYSSGLQAVNDKTAKEAHYRRLERQNASHHSLYLAESAEAQHHRQCRNVGVQVVDGADGGFTMSPALQTNESTDNLVRGKLRLERDGVYVSDRHIKLRRVEKSIYEDKNKNKIDINDWYVNRREQLADYYGCHMTDAARIKNQWGEEVRDYAGFLAKKSAAAAQFQKRLGSELDYMYIGLSGTDWALMGIFEHVRATLERRRRTAEKWRQYERQNTREALSASGSLLGSQTFRSSIVVSGERARDGPFSSTPEALRRSLSFFSEQQTSNELLSVKCGRQSSEFTRRFLDFTAEAGVAERPQSEVFPRRELFKSAMK